MSVYKWSTTAATNDDVDSTINWQEGQSPASVNNSARAMMAAIAKFRDDMSGNLVTAGTSTAYTLTTNQVFTALTDGIFVAARMDEVNGASPTLNVDGLGAKSIATVYGTAVGAGKLRAGAIYVFVYDSTDDKWIVQGNPNDAFESGTKMLFVQTSAPVGWTKETTYDNFALRLVTGSVSIYSIGMGFSDAFTNRFITEAMLPSHTHTYSGTAGAEGSHQHFVAYVDSTTTALSASNILTRSRSAGAQSDYTLSGGAGPADIGVTSLSGLHTHPYSGTTSTGSGSSAAFPFNVNLVDVIMATKD